MNRTFLITIRDPRAFILYLFQTVFIVFFGIGLFYNLSQDYGSTPFGPTNKKLLNNRIGSFFFLLLNCYFGVLFNSAFKMVKENKIIYKEISSRMYSTSLFYLVRSIVDILLLVTPIPLFAIIVKNLS